MTHQLDFNLWPQGKKKALTLSYDDGQIFDERLAAIFDQHQMKATFHLVSGWLNTKGFLTGEQVKELSKKHEISVHCVSHPFLTQISTVNAVSETLLCKDALEKLTGKLIRGLSYPYGAYSESVVELMKASGMEYSRTVQSDAGFAVPSDFLRWNPTCHHEHIGDTLDRFLEKGYSRSPLLYYLWGHSFEFDRNQNWDVIESFCQKASEKEDIWYATNLEIVDYTNASRALRISVDGKMLYNPSAVTVWFSYDQEPISISPGQTLSL